MIEENLFTKNNLGECSKALNSLVFQKRTGGKPYICDAYRNDISLLKIACEIADDLLEFYGIKNKKQAHHCMENYSKISIDFEKEHKVLEIIKEKRVNVLLIRYAFLCNNEGLNFYNKNFGNEECRLTQEEFDLLKEVLK